MIKIIAVLCRLAAPDECHEQMVTSSIFGDVSMQQCFVGQPQLAEWMKAYPGYRLAQWKCVLGTPPERS